MYCCDYCSKILHEIPYICNRCGLEFCSEHHLPKNHHCTCQPEVKNPLLLGVKMFLADLIYIVNMPYDYDRHNCSNFAIDVQNAASKQGMRCGYVRISFEDSEVGHAIIAFETDYGLKFFEPQSANEEDVIVGRHYSADLTGNLNKKIITKVEIFWNDGTNAIIE